jgi:hypothetical protein
MRRKIRSEKIPAQSVMNMFVFCKELGKKSPSWLRGFTLSVNMDVDQIVAQSYGRQRIDQTNKAG